MPRRNALYVFICCTVSLPLRGHSLKHKLKEKFYLGQLKTIILRHHQRLFYVRESNLLHRDEIMMSCVTIFNTMSLSICLQVKGVPRGDGVIAHTFESTMVP